MTRLIDADKIDFMKLPIAPVVKGTDVHYETIAFKEDIDVQPSVEAIPIEWIKKWIESAKPMVHMSARMEINRMIAEWEGEEE